MILDEARLAAMEAYLARPRSIAELVEATGLSQRTVYRWIKVLRERGCDVVTRQAYGMIRFSVLPRRTGAQSRTP